MTPRAPIFVFHDVVPDARLHDVPASHRPYTLPPETFRAFALAAGTSGRRALPVGRLGEELGSLFYGFTFDDGHLSNYTEVFPVLNELGMRATFFVVPTLVDTPGHVRWSQLREMVAGGMEVGSHSLTHAFVDELDAVGLEREFGESKAIIEDRLGAAVRAASLPYGWGPPTLEPVLRQLGYRVFCTSRTGWWHPGDRLLAVPRVRAQRDMGVERFAAIVNAERRALWSLQIVEAAKNAVKTFVGRRAWARLRAPLLRLRYAQER
jgi:peptidoglycan/xylan/chitin deacetylase (PgdA/CDA1 family)